MLRPLIGGTFARPHDRFPSIFANPFWQKYPYFLPCFISACFSAFAFFIALVFLKEVGTLHPGLIVVLTKVSTDGPGTET